MKLALIGRKLSHSYSAIIHKLFFEYTGIKGSYELVEIKTSTLLESRINQFINDGFTGINVTIPYKKDVLTIADSISTETQKIKAANTLLFENGLTKAYNTDYYGFLKTLEVNKVNPKGKKWLILGSGGASQSIKTVLLDLGADIFIASRNPKGKTSISYNQITDFTFDGLVNTTPVGMHPDINECILDETIISRFKTVIDIIYNPLMTQLLIKADRNHSKIIDGLYMLVAQAVKAQEIWNNKSFDNQLIDKIYKDLGEMI